MTTVQELVRETAERARTDAAAAWAACAAEPPPRSDAALAAVAIGAAAAAAGEHESRMRADEALLHDPDHQRRLGAALGRLEAAECILEEAGEDDGRLRAVAREAFGLAYAALHDLAAHAAGTGAASEQALRAVLGAAGDATRAEAEHARALALERLALTDR